MKVFVPMSDALLSDQGELTGTLVPFDPLFLTAQVGEDDRPANWISDTDFNAACQRLSETARPISGWITRSSS